MVQQSAACARLLVLYIYYFFLLFDSTKPLKLMELDVPKYVSVGKHIPLACRWQLGPADVLYSVKWYKDGKEFFRHVPRDVEPRKKFPLPGVDVKEFDSLGSTLVLSSAIMSSGGRYRCEVSGEGPLFPTVSEHRDLEIVVLPEHGPIISGFNSKYRIRDRVQVSCISGHSVPATQLAWYINGEPWPEELVPSYRSENGLIVTTLKLDFEVKESFITNNGLKIKCLATLTPVYWKSSEETAVQDKTITYHDIELDESRIARADRVQSNAVSSFRNFLLILYLNLICLYSIY